MASQRQYTEEDRARVLGDVALPGVCGAAEQHVVPQNCASR